MARGFIDRWPRHHVGANWERATRDRGRAFWLAVAMKSIEIAELEDRLSEHLRTVEQGDEVIVTDRSRPIARIAPFAGGAGGPVLVPPRVPFATVRTRTWQAADWRASGQLVAEEGYDWQRSKL
jgi:prevent-host-death family protein